MNGIRAQRVVTNSAIPHPEKPRDAYMEWMRSESNMQSLWDNEDYRDALLTYLGRIYGQKPKMHNLFMQITKENGNLDELDILDRVIQKTKQCPG